MGSRARRKSQPLPRARPRVQPRRSFALAAWLAGSFVVALGILLVLFVADVRFGQGFFAIRYSPVALWRLQRALAVLPLAVMACAAVWALARRGRAEAAVGRVLLAAAMLGAGVWAWYGPPEPLNQQAFNMTSFSTDGAFVFEARKISSIRTYLREFADKTLPQEPCTRWAARACCPTRR